MKLAELNRKCAAIRSASLMLIRNVPVITLELAFGDGCVCCCNVDAASTHALLGIVDEQIGKVGEAVDVCRVLRGRVVRCVMDTTEKCSIGSVVVALTSALADEDDAYDPPEYIVIKHDFWESLEM